MSESCFSIIDLQRILAIKPPTVVKYQKRAQIGMFVVSVLYCSKVPSKQHSCVQRNNTHYCVRISDNLKYELHLTLRSIKG